jgi:hypothetical protein
MIGSLADQRVFEVLVSIYLPEIYHHLEEVGIPIQLISIPWFMCLYINCLPLEVTLTDHYNLFSFSVFRLYIEFWIASFMREEKSFSNWDLLGLN